ncbi:MAG: EAL domain-containing protein [Thermodesulfobacteriota bacterium]
MKPPVAKDKLTIEGAPPELQEKSQRLLNATIFMVDDEPITMEVVQGFLEEAGYRNFVLIEKSTEAMASLEKQRPDLLLLDLLMPQVSGFDILKAIRGHPKLKHLPVIILTSSSDNRDKLAALDLGATDFLAKPVDPSELRLRVRNTLAAKAYMDQLAFYNPLTKLPNRHLFMEQLEWSLNSARRNGENLALLNIELDQFNRISDTLGLFAGDDVLQQLASRIKEVVRTVDSLGHFELGEHMPGTLFHFDSGTFALLLHRIRNEQDAALVAQRILEAIRAPLSVGTAELYMKASIGIATYPTEDGNNVYMLQLASSAKDYVKNNGGNTFQFSSPQINTQYQDRLSLEARLRRALDRNELVLHYQPKLDVQTNVITGVEALLRWHAQDYGLIKQAKFIPMAEETGLIIPIGEWVMSHVCKQLSEWQKAGKAPIGMSVNLSAAQFQNPEMQTIFKRIIEDSKIDPQLMTLELTESMLLEDIEDKIESMKRLKDLGLKLSIDDFGTGYSSLSYLRRLPLDELKIDRSFFVNLFEDTKGRSLISSLIFLARNLNLRTVAEGVETEQQLCFLQKEGCDQYQGFLFKPPLESAEVFKLLP